MRKKDYFEMKTILFEPRFRYSDISDSKIQPYLRKRAMRKGLNSWEDVRLSEIHFLKYSIVPFVNNN